MEYRRLKGRSSFPFETIAVGVRFSPKLEAIMNEARQLADNFKAKLLLIHVGTHSAEKEATLLEICANMGIDREVRTIWATGDPVTILLHTCKQHMVDLLILSARRRENVFRYYLGSVARGLSRRAKCSLLLLTEPHVDGTNFGKIVVDCVDHPKTPHALNTSFYFASRVGSVQLCAIREVDQTSPAMSVAGDSTTGERTQVKEQQVKDAEEKLIELTCDHATDKLAVETAVLFGRPGFTIRRYAEEYGADLLVIHSPDEQYRLIDRIFAHDLEHILEHLPCNMLIVHARIGDAA
ncbi:MAG: universal stress protein [Proteobacteria bacterium]|nr:universal stress protein [Pseudomonadota bacterium]